MKETGSSYKPLPGDSYLHLSALQKGIRRGDAQAAIRAALALWQNDRQRLIRRIPVIAFEDIGLGSPGLLAKACRSKSWDEIAELVSLMCSAVKSRLADSVFIQAERAAQYEPLREQLAKASERTLAKYVADEEKPLVERAIAVSLLSRPKAVAVIKSLTLPYDFKEACVTAIPLMPWPLPRHLPLIHQEAQKHSCTIRYDSIPTAPDVQGIALCAVDAFTRVGKHCYRLLRQVAPELKAYSIEQIALSVFYIDGGRVDKELTAPGLDVIQRAGELTDLASAGLLESEYSRLHECLSLHLSALNSIRQEQLERFLNAIQTKPTSTPSDVKGGAA